MNWQPIKSAPHEHEEFADLESAVRADERAKVIEECAETLEAQIESPELSDLERYRVSMCLDAIRKLGEKP